MEEQFFLLRLPKDGRPTKTYFFRRPDGSVFGCNERLASATAPRMPGRLEYVGESDGKTFIKAFLAAVSAQDEALAELGECPGSKAGKLKWTKRRREIEAEARAAFAKAQEAEIAVAKKGSIPDMSAEILEASKGVNVSNFHAMIKR